MGRKRAAADDATEPGGESTFPKISKTDAVKAALEAGIEKPKLGIAYIKETFGLDITNSQFSQYKTLGKKKANGVSSAPAAAAPASSNGHHAQTGGGVAESVEAIKLLVSRMGADEVVKIAELFRR